MTGNKALFKTLFEGKIGTVTFGDGNKSVIRGIGTVDIPGLPIFERLTKDPVKKSKYDDSCRLIAPSYIIRTFKRKDE